MKKLAVILFNMGGPSDLASVQPFLFNLFNDPAIIGAPAPIRWLIAKYVSNRRASAAQQIYQRIGGRSPIVEKTEAQAEALQTMLADVATTVRVFVAMRYWHPFVKDVVAKVKAFSPDRIVLLPLYPQFSTTTSGSSLTAWQQEVNRVGLIVPTEEVCCFPTEPGWIRAVTDLLRKSLATIGSERRYRVLFSAHGLPQSIVDRGDPYPKQVERTVAAVVETLAEPNLDWRLCYQSRVGPMRWIGPWTDSEIKQAGSEGLAVVVVPIAFVSEHSETLVELDMEYRHLAEKAGVTEYVRTPTVGTHELFIEGLAVLIQRVLVFGEDVCKRKEQGSETLVTPIF